MDVDRSPSPSSRPPPLPGYFDPESSGRREEYRRYRKRLSSSNASPLLGSSLSKSSEPSLLYGGGSIQRRPNAGLLLEDIKQEAADYSNMDGLDGSARRRGSLDGGSGSDAAFSSGRQAMKPTFKSVKVEEDMDASHEGGANFTTFASLLDSAIQGLVPFPEVILQFERTCRNASESIRSAATGKLRLVDDKLMQQKAQLLRDEAASWSLLWYLYGKENEELPEDLFVILQHHCVNESYFGLKVLLLKLSIWRKRYVGYLFSEHQEELVGVYASQLQHILCVDLFVEMMELRLHSSLHTMYKLFLSAVEYLPFSSLDASKACFEEIIERVLSRSRQTTQEVQ